MVSRLGVDDAQAKLLQQYAATPNARLELLLITDINALAAAGTTGKSTGGASGGKSSGRSSSGVGAGTGAGAAPKAGGAKALDTTQLKAIFREATLDDPKKITPGRVNINTASPEVLRRLLGIDPYTADGIISLRSSKPGGITSVVELLGSNKLTPQILVGLAGRIDVTSQVFTITSRGRSESTGLEVEITAVVDRSTLPARILEYREQ
jgi:DNA uptake protein ComE-like DNA-binding protein